MPTAADSAGEVVRRAKSNLAFALATLPRERRQDMITFYAFCRIVDDIADSTILPVEEKRTLLSAWRTAVLGGGAEGTRSESLARSVASLPAKHGFAPDLLAEIVDGVASDQDKTRFATIDELLGYCYKVASVVGIVSAHIFGATQPRTREYAVTLGYALQLTNILRDVGEDAAESGRIYLPQDEMARFGVSDSDILSGHRPPGFDDLMLHQYERARRYFDEAERLLPSQDRACMIAARMMAAIYSAILDKLRASGFPVFGPRVRLHPLRKGLILAGYLTRGVLRL